MPCWSAWGTGPLMHMSESAGMDMPWLQRKSATGKVQQNEEITYHPWYPNMEIASDIINSVYKIVHPSNKKFKEAMPLTLHLNHLPYTLHPTPYTLYPNL